MPDSLRELIGLRGINVGIKARVYKQAVSKVLVPVPPEQYHFTFRFLSAIRRQQYVSNRDDAGAPSPFLQLRYAFEWACQLAQLPFSSTLSQFGSPFLV